MLCLSLATVRISRHHNQQCPFSWRTRLHLHIFKDKLRRCNCLHWSQIGCCPVSLPLDRWHSHCPVCGAPWFCLLRQGTASCSCTSEPEHRVCVWQVPDKSTPDRLNGIEYGHLCVVGSKLGSTMTQTVLDPEHTEVSVRGGR